MERAGASKRGSSASWSCMAHAVALLAIYLVYGIAQEHIMTATYAGARFEFSAILVVMNRVLSCALAVITLLGSGDSLAPGAPLPSYAWIAGSNVIATLCQYNALHWVTFPTQTISKTGKMLAVMLLSMVVLGKRYGVKHWIVATVLVTGCTVFVLSGNASVAAVDMQASNGADTATTAWIYGLSLMLLYAVADASTGVLQQLVFEGYDTSSANTMLWVSVFATAFSFSSLVWEGKVVTAFAYLWHNPNAALDAAALAACSCVGQLVIYRTVRGFGAVAFATIMTTRQFFSILLSCMWYQHSLLPVQWVSCVVVFAALVVHKAFPSLGCQPNKKEQESQV